MQKGHVRPATWDDLPTLVGDLRSQDLAEIKASSGRTPEEAIGTGILLGAHVGCFQDDTPAAIFGVTPGHETDLGFVWMVATNQFHRLQFQFLRESRKRVEELCRGYRLVMNFTDARNTDHHRWIKWAGFTLIKRHERFGVEQRPFLEFVRITESRDV